MPGKPIDLGAPVTSRGRYITPVRTDPFSVSQESKLVMLLMADARMRRNPGVKVSESSLLAIRHDKVFANSEGACVEQTIFESGGSMSATAVEEMKFRCDRIRISFPATGYRRLGIY